MRRWVSLLCAIGLAVSGVSAASSGGQAAALYRFGLGAQTLGFGGAVISLAHDPATALVNPAGAAYSPGGSLVASHTFMPFDRSINVLGFGRRIDRNAGFDFVWVNGGVDNVPAFDSDGNSAGKLDNSENTVVLTFGNRFGPVAAGVSAKWYHYRLDRRTTSGWAFDLGLMAMPIYGLRVGIAMRDLVGKLIWSTEREQGQFRTEDSFPTTIAAGASYTILPLRMIVAADFENVQGEGRYLHFGASWEVIRQLQVRAGYRWLNLTESAHGSTPTAGLTVAMPFADGEVAFDYSVLDEPLGLVHSLGVRLGL